MPYKDLREFIDILEEKQLFKWVENEVDKDWEISCIVRSIFRGFPPEKRFGVGFKKIKGYEERIVIGVLGASKYTLALAFEVEPDTLKIFEKWSWALANPIDPVIVNSGPCKEVIYKDNDVDLLKFAIPTWTPEKDAGPFLTPLWVTKDPNTKIRNVGMYRAQIKTKNKTGIYLCRENSHAYIHYKKWELEGQPMDAAIVVGADPSIYIPGVSVIPYNFDEFAISGAIRKEAIKLVKCETVDIEVPATSEMVIEGVFLPNEREAEGPFGEWTGYMAAAPFGMPVFHVKCITHRKNPIIQGVLSQRPPSESSGLRQSLYEGAVFKHLTQDLKISGIVDIHLPESTGSNGYLWISLKKIDTGHVQQVASAAFARLGPPLTKWIIVTDDDIDIRDPMEREWVLTFRVRPEEDIHIGPKTASLTMDPSAGDESVLLYNRQSSKVFIDATKKSKYPEIAMPANKYFERVKKDWDKTGLPGPDFSWIK